MNKDKAMSYLSTHPTGNVSTLTDKIGEDMFRDFVYLGYMKTNQSSEQYQITSTFKEDYNAFYKKPGFFMIFKNIIFGTLSKLFVK